MTNKPKALIPFPVNNNQDKDIIFDGYIQASPLIKFDPPPEIDMENMLKKISNVTIKAEESPLLKCQGKQFLFDTRKFSIKQISGDGNCFFNSISYLLTGSEKYHWEIRIAAYKKLSESADVMGMSLFSLRSG